MYLEYIYSRCLLLYFVYNKWNLGISACRDSDGMVMYYSHVSSQQCILYTWAGYLDIVSRVNEGKELELSLIYSGILLLSSLLSSTLWLYTPWHAVCMLCCCGMLTNSRDHNNVGRSTALVSVYLPPSQVSSSLHAVCWRFCLSSRSWFLVCQSDILSTIPLTTTALNHTLVPFTHECSSSPARFLTVTRSRTGPSPW